MKPFRLGVLLARIRAQLILHEQSEYAFSRLDPALLNRVQRC